MGGSGAGFSMLGDGLADGDAGDAGDGHDVADLRSRSMSMRLSPLNVKSLVILVLCSEPSRLEMFTSSPVRSVPLNTRAMARRPR